MMFEEQKEREKLNRIFERLPENAKLLTEGLICNASFMICELEKLQNQIAGSGEVEQYLHGKGQSGNIMSAATKSYLQMQKNYVQTINALTKLLPEVEEEDEFLRFVNSMGERQPHREEVLKEFSTDADNELAEAEMMERVRPKLFDQKQIS